MNRQTARLRWSWRHALFLLGVLFLAAFPWISESRSMLILLTQVFILAVYAMSYDILLGYTGIVSFGHAMFFGIGAYTVGILLKRVDDTLTVILMAVVVAIVLAAAVSFIIGALSLRLKSHYYAMLSLAFAGLFLVVAEKWRSLTMGNDGFTFTIPELLRDREMFYYISLLFMLVMYGLLRRFIQSPMGKVLEAIRENEQRAESLGYKTLHYKIIASIVAGVAAALSGIMYALALRFVNTSVFAVETTLDALLMTIVGGVGTLFGGIVGAFLIEFAHHWLTNLAKVHWIFERWIIFFGIVYVLIVLFFPRGIVGTVQQWQAARSHKRRPSGGEKTGAAQELNRQPQLSHKPKL